jgi:hypothetical protein
MDRHLLPDCFCWTRFGTEAGQAIAHILQRKERERAANGGLFIWGIGNAVGPSIRELVRRTARPEVLFSPIRSSPKAQDVEPPAVAAWTLGETLDGSIYRMPEYSLVTSRYDPDAPRDAHYALVCFSNQPLIAEEPVATVPFGALKNLRTGRPIGASQVTAVVLREEVTEQNSGRGYAVTIRAELAYPYFVRLRRPVILPQPASAEAANHEWSRLAFERLKETVSSLGFGDHRPLEAVLPF